MQAMRHRGWDSTGFALYGTARDDSYVVRALDRSSATVSMPALDELLTRTRAYGADFIG